MPIENEVAPTIAVPNSKSHRHFFTPERFVWMMLLLEICLWLSRWFAFNEKKA
jgi:hypothetical protein